MAEINFSKSELKDLTKAWLVLSIAFAILLTGPKFSLLFVKNLAVSALTVGSGFLLHELAHKFLAQKYGCKAEFKAFPLMLAITLFGSLFGFVFAAPGAVFISGHNISTRKNGKVSLVGPLTNLVLSLGFFAILFVSQSELFQLIGSLGAKINAWLALFNMIPFGPFDGKKVWNWSKVVWFIFSLSALALVMLF